MLKGDQAPIYIGPRHGDVLVHIREIIIAGLSKADFDPFQVCNIYYAYIVHIAALHAASSYHTSVNVIQSDYQERTFVFDFLYGAESLLYWLIEIARIRSIYCVGKSSFLRI